VEIELVEQLLDDVDTNRIALFADLLGDVGGGQIGPGDFGLCGTASGVVLQNFLEVLDDLGDLDYLFFRPPPGLRMRLGSSSGGRRLRSSSPWRMVLGSMPRTREM
jgi:hypothetical protein